MESRNLAKVHLTIASVQRWLTSYKAKILEAKRRNADDLANRAIKEKLAAEGVIREEDEARKAAKREQEENDAAAAAADKAEQMSSEIGVSVKWRFDGKKKSNKVEFGVGEEFKSFCSLLDKRKNFKITCPAKNFKFDTRVGDQGVTFGELGLSGGVVLVVDEIAEGEGEGEGDENEDGNESIPIPKPKKKKVYLRKDKKKSSSLLTMGAFSRNDGAKDTYEDGGVSYELSDLSADDKN